MKKILYRFYTYEEDREIIKRIGRFYSVYQTTFFKHLSTEAGIDYWEVHDETDVSKLFYAFGQRQLKVVFPDQL